MVSLPCCSQSYWKDAKDYVENRGMDGEFVMKHLSKRKMKGNSGGEYQLVLKGKNHEPASSVLVESHFQLYLNLSRLQYADEKMGWNFVPCFEIKDNVMIFDVARLSSEQREKNSLDALDDARYEVNKPENADDSFLLQTLTFVGTWLDQVHKRNRNTPKKHIYYLYRMESNRIERVTAFTMNEILESYPVLLGEYMKVPSDKQELPVVIDAFLNRAGLFIQKK